MIKIGITGGIGSGKSVVASLFRLFGVPVYIADEESKQLTNQSETIRKQLIAHYGEAIYTPEGLNKPLLIPSCLLPAAFPIRSSSMN